MTRIRTAALFVSALAATSILSGCGALHPGVAVQAGDERLTLAEADEITRDLCTAVLTEQQGSVYPMEAIRRGVVHALALRSAASQLAEQYDVTPGETYTAAVKGYEQSLVSLPEQTRAHALEVITASDYVQGVLIAIGTVELANAGVTNPSASDAGAKGESIIKAWTAEHGVEIDPRFDLTLGENGLDMVPSDTSYAASDFAKNAVSAQPSQEYVAALPASQRCG